MKTEAKKQEAHEAKVSPPQILSKDGKVIAEAKVKIKQVKADVKSKKKKEVKEVKKGIKK